MSVMICKRCKKLTGIGVEAAMNFQPHCNPALPRLWVYSQVSGSQRNWQHVLYRSHRVKIAGENLEINTFSNMYSNSN